MQHVVYTAIAGDYDELKPQPAQSNVRYVAFIEGRQRAVRPWEVRALPQVNSPDPCRRAKFPKVLSHLVLPDAEYSLWMDGTFMLVGPTFTLPQLIKRYLANTDLAILKHPVRNCVYEEAKAVLITPLDDPKLIMSHVERYRADGYPERAGLGSAGIIVRRHTPTVAEFNEAWWHEIEHGSRRDQLSFPYVAWKLGLRYTMIPWPKTHGFRRTRHRKPRRRS